MSQFLLLYLTNKKQKFQIINFYLYIHKVAYHNYESNMIDEHIKLIMECQNKQKCL